jgi:TIR domain
MSDIFISYNKQDRPQAQIFAQALERRGWSTFWDQTIPAGTRWRDTIEKELIAARCVIVLWSQNSIRSDWVREEAEHARRRSILVPVLIDDIEPPLGFQSIQAANLANWDGKEPNQSFIKLIADIEALIGPPLNEATEEMREPPLNEVAEVMQEAIRQQREAIAMQRSGQFELRRASPEEIANAKKLKMKDIGSRGALDSSAIKDTSAIKGLL